MPTEDLGNLSNVERVLDQLVAEVAAVRQDVTALRQDMAELRQDMAEVLRRVGNGHDRE